MQWYNQTKEKQSMFLAQKKNVKEKLCSAGLCCYWCYGCHSKQCCVCICLDSSSAALAHLWKSLWFNALNGINIGISGIPIHANKIHDSCKHGEHHFFWSRLCLFIVKNYTILELVESQLTNLNSRTICNNLINDNLVKMSMASKRAQYQPTKLRHRLRSGIFQSLASKTINLNVEPVAILVLSRAQPFT